jgi:hypothetical protein
MRSEEYRRRLPFPAASRRRSCEHNNEPIIHSQTTIEEVRGETLESREQKRKVTIPILSQFRRLVY